MLNPSVSIHSLRSRDLSSPPTAICWMPRILKGLRLISAPCVVMERHADSSPGFPDMHAEPVRIEGLGCAMLIHILSSSFIAQECPCASLAVFLQRFR